MRLVLPAHTRSQQMARNALNQWGRGRRSNACSSFAPRGESTITGGAKPKRSTDAVANGPVILMTITRPDFEILLDFNRDMAYKILRSMVRLLSSRLRVTNDNLRSLLAISMF